MKKSILFLLIIFSITQAKAQLVSETVIGITMYDIQCNISSYNRIVQNTDGSVSAVWNYSPDSSVAMPLRGTGYNYYDGSTWGAWPSARTEISRTGFTNIINTSSGKELSIQHTGTSISVNYRATKGVGAWTYSQPWGNNSSDSWPKAACSGDSVYAIWNGTGLSNVDVAGQFGPIYFSASYDGGQSWTPKQIISLIDSSHYRGWNGERYSIDAKNGIVAIVYGDLKTDLGILKSSDGGQTWTQIIVQTHPIPHYGDYTLPTDTNMDGIIDTLHTTSGDQTILIDNNGMCHVWFSELRWYCNGGGTPGIVDYLQHDGLNYWNESMGSDNYIRIAGIQDLNMNGRIDFPVNPSLCWPFNLNQYSFPYTSRPSAGIDATGTIYLAYQTIDESSDSTIWGTIHVHSFIKTLPQIAGAYDVNNWTYPFSISRSTAQGGNDEFEEVVAPSITKNVGQYAYVVYQRDLIPGVGDLFCTATDSIDSYTNEIVVAKIEAATVGINTVDNGNIFSLIAFPNPTRESFELQFSLKEKSDVKIEMFDHDGKNVYSKSLKNLATGKSKVDISSSNLSSGIYYCSLISKDQKTVCKVVIIP